MQYGQKAQTPDQTNNFFEPKSDLPVHIVMCVVGTLDLIREKKVIHKVQRIWVSEIIAQTSI